MYVLYGATIIVIEAVNTLKGNNILRFFSNATDDLRRVK
jgi:hypothetical protein